MNKPLKKGNAFSELGSILGAGFDTDMMQEGDELLIVDVSDVFVSVQIRQEFSRDGESTMEEMTASVKKHGVITPVLMRRLDGKHPYELVAGGRRFASTLNAEISTIPALVRTMTDEQVKELQFIENIHRLNLSQIEEAKRLQETLDELGSVEAVLEKFNKTRSWLSKVLSLLTLPEETKRLVTEKVTADVEVIGMVKQIEKVNPTKAKAVVEQLKATRGKEDARAIAKKAKDEVKPSKKISDGITATPKDLTSQEPGAVTVKNFADAKSDGEDETWPFKTPGHEKASIEGDDPFKVDASAATIGHASQEVTESPRPVAFSPAQVLNKAYTNIFENGSSPKMVLDVMQPDDKEAVEGWLHSFYDAGKQAKDASRAVIQGFRKGQFSSDGDGAFALVAFLHGADSEAKFSILNIFGSVKE